MDSGERRLGKGAYDSVFLRPDSVDSTPEDDAFAVDSHTAEHSRVDLRGRGRDDIIAVAFETPALRSEVLNVLGGRNLELAGADSLARASLVIAEAAADTDAQLADLRRMARPDAAILIVLRIASAEMVARAHAAGAFACLRPPLVREELLGLVTAAQDSWAARVQAADLARKLDLESHLASVGRISAGLAHEVSSPLGAAALNMETVERECGRLVGALKWLAFSPAEDLARRLAVTRDHISAFEAPEGLAGAIADTMAAHQRLSTLFDTMRGLVGRTHQVQIAPVDLLALVHEVRRWQSEELRGIAVEVVGEPLQAMTDRTLLGQLLTNLTSNAAHAAKALSAPRIRLHVYSGERRAIVSVRDNGPGIPLDLQDRIFEPFFTTRRGRGGTGLGLALCREYALQIRADLSLWSVPGRGSCFRVNMPKMP